MTSDRIRPYEGFVKGYWWTVAAIAAISFVTWAFWTIYDFPSPLRANRNYEGLFLVLYGCFVYAPAWVTFYWLHDGSPILGAPLSSPERRIVFVLTFCAGYIATRGPILALQALVLAIF